MGDDGRSSELRIALIFLLLLLVIPLGLGFVIQDNIEQLYQLLNQGLEQALILGDVALIAVALYILSGVIFPEGATPPQIPTEPGGYVPTGPGGVPPVTPPPHVPPPPVSGGGKVVPGACVLNYYWHVDAIGLAAAIGDKPGHQVQEESSNGPIPMAAKGKDQHLLVEECKCGESLSYHSFPGLDAILRYDWEVSLGGGGFIKKKGEMPERTMTGKQVIYQPPEIEHDFPDPRSIHETHVQVKSTHIDPSKPPMHQDIVLGLHLKITRKAKDKFVLEWWPAETIDIQYPHTLPNWQTGQCKTAFTWMDKLPLSGFIEGPKECEPEEYVRFEVKANDEDSLKLDCVPGGECKLPSSQVLDMTDMVNYDWFTPKGKFVKSPTSNSPEIVWHAPKEEGIVRMRLRMFDSQKEFLDGDMIVGWEIMVKKSGPPTPGLFGLRKKEKKGKKKETEEGKEKGESSPKETEASPSHPWHGFALSMVWLELFGKGVAT